MLCPLCHSQDHQSLRHRQAPGEMFHCQNCDLIFKSSSLHLEWDKQKLRYDQHNNHIENPGYIEFFEQLLKPLRQHLPEDARILDWGAGPGEKPVLAELLRKENFNVELYDPIYHPKIEKSVYDVIVSTEVLEHFQNPRDSLDEILRHLTTKGIFAGLTNFHQGPEKFENWWYVKDTTHVVFYSEKTFHWISQKWNLEILHLENPIFIFKKN